MGQCFMTAGEESVLRGLNNAEDGDDSPTLLTFKSGQLTKVGSSPTNLHCL